MTIYKLLLIYNMNYTKQFNNVLDINIFLLKLVSLFYLFISFCNFIYIYNLKINLSPSFIFYVTLIFVARLSSLGNYYCITLNKFFLFSLTFSISSFSAL